MTELDLCKNWKLCMNLRKGAKRILRETDAKHVVFGVLRNEKGQLSTYMHAFSTDSELWAFEKIHNKWTKNIIWAVHR